MRNEDGTISQVVELKARIATLEAIVNCARTMRIGVPGDSTPMRATDLRVLHDRIDALDQPAGTKT